MSYLLSLPFRLILMLLCLLGSSLFMIGPATHLLIAHKLKTEGKATKARVLEKVKSRKVQGNKWSKQYYVLQLPEGKRSLRSNKRYTEGRYLDVVYLANPPTTIDIPWTQGKQKMVIMNSQKFIVPGNKQDWLIWLYLASAKKDFADYSVTHITLGLTLFFLAIRIILPFPAKKSTQ